MFLVSWICFTSRMDCREMFLLDTDQKFCKTGFCCIIMSHFVTTVPCIRVNLVPWVFLVLLVPVVPLVLWVLPVQMVLLVKLVVM